MEFLSDPCNDRVLKDVPEIISDVIKRDDLWHTSPDKVEVPNLQTIRTYLLREGHIAKQDLIEIIRTTIEIMVKE